MGAGALGQLLMLLSSSSSSSASSPSSLCPLVIGSVGDKYVYNLAPCNVLIVFVLIPENKLLVGLLHDLLTAEQPRTVSGQSTP